MSRYPAILLGSLVMLALAGCKDSVSSDAEAAPRTTAAGAAHQGDEVLATIDGEPIYRSQIESKVAFRVFQLRADIYALLKSQTDEMIEARLLEREATRRGVSVDELLQSEVEARIAAVDEAEIDAYLASWPAAASQGERARARAAYYLRERRRIERRLAFVQSLRDNAAVAIELEAPERPRTDIDITRAPRRGPEDAPVTLVHFASFSAPASLRSAAEVRAIFDEHPGKIRWVHRHFIDAYDEVGLQAAKLAVIAQDQGLFWAFHDRVYDRDSALTADALAHIAADLGLRTDTGRDSELLGRIKEHVNAARTAGVEGLPVIFVNGRYFSGTFPYERLRAMVAEEIGASK